jgi:adenine-specific DNA-methyltransferase
LNKTEKFILQKLGKDSLEELEQQDYIGLIRQLNKYGLRFEEQPEEVEEKLKDFYPVLTDYNRKTKTINLAGEEKEVKEIKDIINDEKGKMNYIIEGDNLHGLKAIEKIYEEKCQILIADPPYNTGNGFQYNDKIVGSDDDYRHSKWLSFMKKRLKVIHGLLSKDGIAFIHIDNNEQSQLKLLMDEVFGEKNFITMFDWISSTSKGNDSKFIANQNEYILCYCKNKDHVSFKQKEVKKEFKYTDEYSSYRGKYNLNKLDRGSLRYAESLDYSIVNDKGEKIYPGPSSKSIKEKRKDHKKRINGNHTDRDWCWRWSKSKVQWGLKKDFIVFKNENVYYKEYELVDNTNSLVNKTNPYKNIIDFVKTSTGNQEIINIFNERIFDYPKPVKLIKYLIKLHPNPNAKIIDPFAGSGTTGHAVLELNKEDGGNRSFILMTNNENTSLNKKYLIWDYLVENNIVEDYDKTKFTSTGKRYQYYKNHINKNFPLNIDKHYNIEIKQEHQENKKLQGFIETDKFKTFLENLKLYIADNGICQNVTYPRMRKVIEGYTDSKGNKVEGLGGNLSYLKTDFVPKYKELDKRELALSNKIYNLIKMSEEAHIEINVEEDFYKLYKSEVKENKIVAFYNRVLDYNELKTIQNKMEEFKDYKKIVYIRNGIDFEDKLISELQEKGYIFKEIPEELMYL